MTPKDKAKELVVKYSNLKSKFNYSDPEGLPYVLNGILINSSAKQCALIAVDEILKALQVPPIENKGHVLYDSQIDYWQEVKQEIERI